jgi:putative DNA primase/helicase
MFAMIFALLDKSDVIEPQHIKAALAWVRYWRDSVMYIFATLAAKAEAERLNDAAADVLAFISQNPRCSRTAITTGFRNKLTSQQITAALNHLLNSAPPLIRQEEIPRADGKPGKGSTVFWMLGKQLRSIKRT